jgi:hypothetical protein
VNVGQATQVVVDALTPHLYDDWTIPVPGLDFTVSSVLAHATLGPLWYALDMWAGESDSAAFTLTVAPDAAPSALLASLRQAGLVCAASLAAAPADLRGFHPAGSPDPSGFAAMACAELLIHTDDALRGLGTRLAPPPDLAAAVLERLFPAPPQGEDPWQTLLWAHNRPNALNRPSEGEWRWHPAPRG